MSTFKKKLAISVGSALLFVLVNLPQTYKFTDDYLPLNISDKTTGCPTKIGLLIHTIFFAVLTYLSMENPYKNTGIKLNRTIYGTLIFFLASSPTLFSLSGKVLGPSIASTNGCPTINGILLHAAIYCSILIGVMYLPE